MQQPRRVVVDRHADALLGDLPNDPAQSVIIQRRALHDLRPLQTRVGGVEQVHGQRLGVAAVAQHGELVENLRAVASMPHRHGVQNDAAADRLNGGVAANHVAVPRRGDRRLFQMQLRAHLLAGPHLVTVQQHDAPP